MALLFRELSYTKVLQFLDFMLDPKMDSKVKMQTDTKVLMN